MFFAREGNLQAHGTAQAKCMQNGSPGWHYSARAKSDRAARHFYLFKRDYPTLGRHQPPLDLQFFLLASPLASFHKLLSAKR